MPRRFRAYIRGGRSAANAHAAANNVLVAKGYIIADVKLTYAQESARFDFDAQNPAHYHYARAALRAHCTPSPTPTP